VNFHQEGDILEAACIKELLCRWPNSRFIETKTDSIHGIDFAIELAGGGVGIIESKSATGSVKNPQMSKQWIRSRINTELHQAIVRAVKVGRPIFYATYRTSRITDPKNKQLLGFKVRSAGPTGELQWQDLFPDQPLPAKDDWKMVRQDAVDERNELIVTHVLKDGSSKQSNEYKLTIKQISKAVYDSTLRFKTFPFNIPHSHTVIDNGRLTYERSLAQWDEHVEHKGLVSDSSVHSEICVTCHTRFYDTSSHNQCYYCFVNAQASTKTLALNICQKAEAACSSSDHKATNELLKQLQQQWRELGSIPKEDNDKLWQRFQSATQSFYDARSKYFEQQDGIRQNNKSKAKSLITQAQNLSRSTDWKDTGQKIKQLQNDWKQVNPLPKDDADQLWQQFQSSTQVFFDARGQYFEQQDKLRQSNKSKAKSLILQAQKLSHSTDWKATSQKVKQLQGDWKQVNPLPKEDADKLWQQFQSATQAFYDARSKHFEQQDKLRQNNKSKAKGLIVQAQNLSSSTDWKATGQKVKQLQGDWKQVNPLPKEDADKLWQQFQSATQAFYDRRTQHFDDMEAQRSDNRRKAQRLIDEAKRCANSSDWKGAAAQIKDLQQQWKGVNPLPRDDADRLWREFKDASQAFFDRRTRFYDEQNRQWQEKMKASIRKAQDSQRRIDDSIDHDLSLIDRWRGTISSLRDGPRAEEIRRSMEDKIYSVQDKIRSKKEKIADIDESIRDMERKLRA
jgi:hypothetical protein